MSFSWENVGFSFGLYEKLPVPRKKMLESVDKWISLQFWASAKRTWVFAANRVETNGNHRFKKKYAKILETFTSGRADANTNNLH